MRDLSLMVASALVVLLAAFFPLLASIATENPRLMLLVGVTVPAASWVASEANK